MKRVKIDLIVNPKSFENEDYNKGKIAQIDDELEFLNKFIGTWIDPSCNETELNELNERIEHLTTKRKELTE